MKISLEDIKKAREILTGNVVTTSTQLSRTCSDLLGTEVYLKYENHQLTGSFKIRGAYNKIHCLSAEEKARGVIAASAGNHAQGVALSASKLGVPSYIVMPENSSLVKAESSKNYGAEVILYGEAFDEAYQYAKNLAESKGYVFVHPFDDPLVIAGQGTIGLELLEQVSDLESVVIAIGGGGLISGVATAIKSINPQCKIYGAVTENFPSMLGLYRDKEMSATGLGTIADGIAVKKPNETIFKNYIEKYVDDIVAVDEESIAQSMVFLIERAKTVVEGSGAIGLAAARKGQWDLGGKTAFILCGGNIDLNIISKTIERGLSQAGRLTRFNVIVLDKPGVLSSMTSIIAREGANILEVSHDRLDPMLSMRETKIQFLLEAKNHEQVTAIQEAIEALGARIV